LTARRLRAPFLRPSNARPDFAAEVWDATAWSEKDDMNLPEKGNATAPNGHTGAQAPQGHERSFEMQRPPAHSTATPAEGFDPLLEGLIPRRAIVPAERADRELRCASSGYLSDGCRCQITIPEHVVAAAWERERLFGNTEDRFFRVVWRDEVWLAYGLGDGTVRGVYCPAHRAERDERCFELGVAGEVVSNELTPV
jgi:hypothetical protein